MVQYLHFNGNLEFIIFGSCLFMSNLNFLSLNLSPSLGS